MPRTTLDGLAVSFWHWVTWGFIVAPAPTFLHLGVHFCVFSVLWVTFGAPVWHPWAPFWRPWVFILMSFCHFEVNLAPQQPLIAKSLKKCAKLNDLGAQLGAFWDTFSDLSLLKSSRQPFCRPTLLVFFQKRFQQRFEAGFYRKWLNLGGARCVFETVKTDVSARSSISTQSLRKLM